MLFLRKSIYFVFLLVKIVYIRISRGLIVYNCNCFCCVFWILELRKVDCVVVFIWNMN